MFIHLKLDLLSSAKAEISGSREKNMKKNIMKTLKYIY